MKLNLRCHVCGRLQVDCSCGKGEINMKHKCVFTHDMADQLSCSRDGNFDEYGFPEKTCPLFPCEKYKNIIYRNSQQFRDELAKEE